MGARADGRSGHPAVRGCVRRSRRGRCRHRQLLRHDRRAARQQRQCRRSFRQARCQRPHLERAGKALPARSAAVRALLRQRGGRAGERGVARPLLSGHLPDQRRQSRRRGAVAASRLSHGIPDGRSARALPRARASAVAGPDAARRSRPLRHAGGDRPDAVSAVLADLRARLPGLAPAGVHRLFRQAPHPAAALQGRCGVLQPGPVPRRRQQPHRRREAHRQPAAGLLGLRPRHGERRSHAHERGALSGAAGARQRAQRGGVRQRRRRLRGGLFVPHQPRSRSAARGPRARDAGSAHAEGAGGEVAGRGVRQGAREAGASGAWPSARASWRP